jgi:hypothetical protein
MNLNEQISRIRGLIYELAPQSSGVQEFIAQVQEKPELLKHMNFRNMENLLDYIDNANYEEFSQLRDEVNHFINRRKKYFQSEIDAFEKAKEVKIPDDVWGRLENTESNQIKKGEINKVIALAKQYNKQHPKELKKALLSGDYRRPLILKFGDRYHLVAGNTRLCTAAALGIQPQVLIGEI